MGVDLRWENENSRSIEENSRSFDVHFSSGFEGLPKKSWVKISQIRTLAVERIGKVIGRASPEELAEVIEGLNEIIGT